MKKLTYAAFTTAVLAPFLALAQANVGTPVTPPTYSGPTGLNTVTGWFGLFRTILSWVGIAFWITAAVFIFLAAFKYLTAAGDPEKVKSASHSLLYAVVAIAVGILAYGIPALVGSFLGGT